MTNSISKQLGKVGVLIAQPLIWAHEYCHYWVARSLGLLARIQGAKTYVHCVDLRQHVLIALAPTIPSLVITFVFAVAYHQLATTTAAKINLGSFTAIGALLLLSCVSDWWSIIHSLFDPSMLSADSVAILIVSAAPDNEQHSLKSRIESMGYFVEWARSKEDAINCLNRNLFDPIMLDVNVTGIEQRSLSPEVEFNQKNRSTMIFRLKSHTELLQLPTYLESGIPPGRSLEKLEFWTWTTNPLFGTMV